MVDRTGNERYCKKKNVTKRMKGPEFIESQPHLRLRNAGQVE